MNITMDALLVTFNTLGAPLVYNRNGMNATLDGYPIRWTGVHQAYSTAAAASAHLASFGAFSYTYLGERGQPRVESSREVYFATDEIALRALERIDIEQMATDSMSALLAAAV
jgi:HK97 family phage major capsid protein